MLIYLHFYFYSSLNLLHKIDCGVIFNLWKTLFNGFAQKKILWTCRQANLFRCLVPFFLQRWWFHTLIRFKYNSIRQFLKSWLEYNHVQNPIQIWHLSKLYFEYRSKLYLFCDCNQNDFFFEYTHMCTFDSIIFIRQDKNEANEYVTKYNCFLNGIER